MLSELVGASVRWIPALPLVTGIAHGIAVGILRRRMSPRSVGWSSVAATGLAFALSVLAFWELIAQDDNAPIVDRVGTWIGVGVAPGVLTADVAFRFDALSAVFCLLVTGVGTVVQIHAIGFMERDERDDRGVQRYFGYTDLFLASMLVLILADDLVLLLLGWVGSAVFGVLLIGFWYGDGVRIRAASRVFALTRIGDVAFLLGILLVYRTLAAGGVASLSFAGIEAGLSVLGEARLQLPALLGAGEMAAADAIGLCFFVAVCAKTAQLPFIVWMPGAMEAPSPASALVHGMCVAAAGVYLLARLYFVLALAPLALTWLAWTGGVTALVAAGVACVELDIKKVLGLTAVAHTGLMLLGIGAGDPTSSVQHAVSHAFFQPALFLGAGIVIAGLQGDRDLSRMGNIGSRVHLTRICMWLALLSSIGVPPFWAGYFSRQQILLASHGAVHVPGHVLLYGLALCSVALIAFAVVRLMYLALYGDSRFSGELRARIDEPASILLRPLGFLAALSVAGSVIGLPQHWADLFPFEVEESDSLRRFLSTVPSIARGPALADSRSSWIVTGYGVAMTALGALPAGLLYLLRPRWPRRLAARLRWPYRVARRGLYLEDLLERGLVRPALTVSDRVLARGLEARVIDGLAVDAAPGLIRRVTDRVLKLWQPGIVQLYLAVVLLGGALLVAWLVSGAGAVR